MAEQLFDQAPFGIDNGPVLAVAFSPDGAMVASAGEDGDVYLRDARTGERLGQLASDNETVWSMAFSPDGTVLVIGDEDGSVRAWDPNHGEERTPLAEDIGLVMSVSFIPDGGVLAVGTDEGALRFLDTRASIRTKMVETSTEPLSAAFSPDGMLLAVGGRDGLIRTWDTRTGDPRHSYVGHRGEVQAVAINPDGTLLTGGGLDGHAWLWDVHTGSEIGWLRVEVGAVQAMAFSPDGTLLAVAGTAGPVCLWDVPAGQQREALLTGHEGWVSSVAFSPDGTGLVTGGGQDGTVRLWDVRTGAQHGGPRPIGVNALVFSHDGSVLAGVGADGSVRLWQAPRMGRHVQPADQDDPVASLAFSPDDTLLAGGGVNGSLTVWDVRTGERRERNASDFGSVLSVGFGPRPDGGALALSVLNGTARVWAGDGGWNEVASNPGTGSVEVAAFRPDGIALALGTSDGTVWTSRAYLRDSYPQDVVLRGHVGPVRSVAFNPEGDILATAGDDGAIRLWDAATGYQRVTLTGHSGPVRSVAFGLDGQELASGGDDGSVRVWDARTGEPRYTRAGHIGPARAVAFSLDGSILASGGDDGVRIWDPQVEYDIRSFGFADPSGDHITEQALADANRAVESTPDSAEALAARADILRDVGRLDEALADADRAVELDSRNSVALLTRARILRDMGRFDEALVRVSEVVTAEPSNLHAQLDLARILYAMGRYDEALDRATMTAERSGEPEAELLKTVLTAEIRDRSASEPERSDASQPAAAPARSEAPFPASLGGGYNADDAGDPSRQDALGFTDDVKMLCSVLADRKALPPLSVGLFGEWGSGKSFFMRLMQQRIARLSEAARDAEANRRETRYCSHVVQITFNAWHYMDANLWASLAAEIFFRLASPDSDAASREQAEVDRQREAILKRLDTCQQLTAELIETRKQAETQRIEIEKQLDQARNDRVGKAVELAKIVAKDVAEQLAHDPGLTKLRKETADELGLSELTPLELPGLVSDLRTTSGMVAAAWRLLAKRKAGWAWAFGLAAAFVVSLLVGLVLLTAHGSQWHGWIAIGATVASLAGFTDRIRPVVTAVSKGLDRAEEARQREEELVQQFRADQATTQAKLEAELERLTAQEQGLAVQLAAAAAAEAEAIAEEQDLRADRRLRKFLEERSGSSDYQSQLGLISLLHKDFRRLDALLGLAREGADHDLPRIDRIILYIDDLDRCPPARVVDVLQAMHLLLALPLFVVVVGVDPRWLLGSLKRHYGALLQVQASERAASADMSHWASTPQDYLEKIFQIPFALMPMTSGGFAQLVSDLAGEPATNGHQETASSYPADQDQPSALGDQPSADREHAGLSGPASRGTAGSDSVQAGSPGPTEDGEGPGARTTSDVGGSTAIPEAGGFLLQDGDATPVLPESSGQPDSPAQTPGSGRPAQQDDAVQSASVGPDGLPSALPPAAEAMADKEDAEEQRIVVRAGSVAGAEQDRIDPNPAGLRLTTPEIHFIQALAPMITTPRIGTRLVNVYRMIRSTQATGGPSRFLDLNTGTGDYQVILILLAIVSGFPDLAAPTFEALLQADPDLAWPAFVDELLTRMPVSDDPGEARPEDWVRMGKALAVVQDRAQMPDGLSAYREWAPRVARFSFAAGHVLSSSAASPPTTGVPRG